MKKINYTLDKNNYIISYTTIPFNETKPYIEVADNYKPIIGKTMIIDGVIFDGVGNEAYLKRQALKDKKPLREELKQIQKWLADNDWKVNKIVIGEWTTSDERWLSYIQERTQKRARQDEINRVLGN